MLKNESAKIVVKLIQSGQVKLIQSGKFRLGHVMVVLTSVKSEQVFFVIIGKSHFGTFSFDARTQSLKFKC